MWTGSISSENPSKEYRERTKERQAASVRRWRLNRYYGLSVLEYETQVALQNNTCAICRLPETAKLKDGVGKVRPLVVDHCHESGLVRGIICDACNVGLSRFKDNIETMRSAIVYLEEFREQRREIA